MSNRNWAIILNIPGAEHYEAVKWIIYQINGYDLMVMNEDQLEHMHGLVAELRRLLEEYCRMDKLDEYIILALKEEIEGIRSGDPMYWCKMLAAIKAASSNPTVSHLPNYIENSQYSTFPINEFGNTSILMNNQQHFQHQQFSPADYSCDYTNNYGNQNNSNGIHSVFSESTRYHHTSFSNSDSGYGDSSYYSPQSNTSSSPVTSPAPGPMTGLESNYGYMTPPIREYMDTGEVEQKLGDIRPAVIMQPHYNNSIPMSQNQKTAAPNNTEFSSSSSSSSNGPQGYVLTSIKNEITDILHDIKIWNLEEENKQRNIDLLLKLDHQFLNSLESKCGRVINQLLSIQTADACKLLESFVSNLLVITKQPDRVIQYKERFSTTVRLLLNSSYIAPSPKNNIVTLKVINEERAEPLDKGLGGVCETKLETSAGTSGGGLISDLHPTIPKNPKKLNKANNPDMLRVHDESFFLQYSVKVKLIGYSKPIQATIYSHPVKITVNSKQDSHAWETVIWDNAAGRFGIHSCRSRPQTLKFMDVVKAVNAYFADTGHGLSLRDYEVVFGILNPLHSPRFLSENGEKEITLMQFRVEQEVPGLNLDLKDIRKISFWMWFFYMKKFILGYVRELWSYEGVIMGYLTQAESRQELSVQSEGAFLIRFSNSTPNAVTVEWNDPGGNGKKAGIYSYRGSCSDLALRSLKDRIFDTARWKIHHPSNFPKETMFENIPAGFIAERSEENPEQNQSMPRIVGYVRAFLQARLSLDFDN